jgi:hypothetical protein
MTHLLASCSFAKSASSSCEGGSLGIKVIVGLLLWLKTSLLLLLLMEPMLLLLLHSLTLRPAAFAVNDNRREQLVRLARRCRTSFCARANSIIMCMCRIIVNLHSAFGERNFPIIFQQIAMRACFEGRANWDAV